MTDVTDGVTSIEVAPDEIPFSWLNLASTTLPGRPAARHPRVPAYRRWPARDAKCRPLWRATAQHTGPDGCKPNLATSQLENTLKTRNLMAASGLAVLALITSAASFADNKARIDARAVEALAQFHKLNPANEQLEQTAVGVLIFPQVTKAGAGIAGEHGDGVLQIKGKTVGYYSSTAASVGLTLGAARRSEIIMFMAQGALDDFMNSKGWSIGADTRIAVITTGGGGDYDSETLKKSILGFVFGEKGLIADASLEGSKITKMKAT
jgi:lipid-binding SYLF domain-containing protein